MALGYKEEILKGQMLAIDPSCISSSSNPGYALFEAGELKEAGIITGISSGRPLVERLQYLNQTFAEDFEEPDVIAIEYISSGGKRNLDSTLRAYGAIISAFSCTKVVEIDASAWQIYAAGVFGSKHTYKEHYKDDHMDARMIGECVRALAKGEL